MRILCVWIKGRDAVGTVITCTQLNAPMRSGASSATHRRRQQHCRLTRLAARTALLVRTSSHGPQGVAQRCRGPSRRRHSQGMTVCRVPRSSHVEASMGQLGTDLPSRPSMAGPMRLSDRVGGRASSHGPPVSGCAVQCQGPSWRPSHDRMCVGCMSLGWV
jgi:hypothetical protein